MNFRKIIFTAFIIFGLIANNSVFSQNADYMSFDEIIDKYPEAIKAQQRIQFIAKEWGGKLKSMDDKIDSLQMMIKNNHLIWTEKVIKNKELQELFEERDIYAKSKFEPGGDFDKITYEIMKPIEEKILKDIK